MNSLAFKIGRVLVPPVAAVLCRPAGYAAIGRIESRNKISTIETVEFANQFLGGGSSLEELIRRIQKVDRFRALWLGEGLGLNFAMRALRGKAPVRNLLTEGEGRLIPENLLLMVHAGMAMAFARHHLDALGNSPSREAIADATGNIAGLIASNSIAGYSGIAYEAWGMAAKFFYGKLFPAVIESMGSIDPEHAPHMWHGTGRACYFLTFMPGWKEPWPVFRLIDKFGSNGVRRPNLLAGLGAVMVIVNMKTPAVLEAVVRERISRLSRPDAAAFAQGILCSMIMREDTTPGDENSRRLLDHTPAADVRELWENIILRPGRLALDKLHPIIKKQHRLDEVTCYRPIELTMDGGSLDISSAIG